LLAVAPSRNRAAEHVVYLPLDRLRVAETNPRKTQPALSPNHGPLRDSIAAQGILVPLIVVPNGELYDVVCGYRRLTAARSLKLDEAPCIVRPMGRLAQLELGLVDNLNRGVMDPVDVGLALMAMRDEGLKQSEIARRIGRSGFYVSRYLAIAELPASVRKQIKARRVTVKSALGPTAGIPRVQLFQRDEELQQAWMGLRSAVIEAGDRKTALALQHFASCWRAFGRAKGQG
jgi:ParB/RepB/Spo0J family partition protein